MARFSEAKVLASLNHPNIAIVHGCCFSAACQFSTTLNGAWCWPVCSVGARKIGGIFTILLAAFLGVLNEKFCIEFLIYGYMFATMISIGSVLQEEVTYKRYNDRQDVLRLVSYCFLEHFPYRQLHIFWRRQGLWQFSRGDLSWKPLKRQGLESAPKVG